MRVRIILSLFVAMFAYANVYARVLDEDLILKGEYVTEGSRSESPVTPPITGVVSDSSLDVNFSDAIGEVQISVSPLNKSAVATGNSIIIDVTSIGQTASISLEGYAPGEYLVEFTSLTGDGYVYGQFTVN